jgi:hypothetical protein
MFVTSEHTTGTNVAKRKITITVDEKLFAAFKHLCGANAMKVSSRVELLMQEWLATYEPPASKRPSEERQAKPEIAGKMAHPPARKRDSGQQDGGGAR